MLEAMVYILRTGIPWRDLPPEFGKWSGVYFRWRRWIESGLWERILSVLTERARGTTRFADSTHIKLHQDGTGPVGGQPPKGIGRTKGGLNTKVTALVDSHGRAVSLSLHSGARNDVKTIESHLCLLCGRTRVADKGFDADSIREKVAATGGDCCIPRRRGCGGTRPFAAAFIVDDIESKTSFAGSNVTAISLLVMINAPPPSSLSFNSPPSSIGPEADFANTP